MVILLKSYLALVLSDIEIWQLQTERFLQSQRYK